MVHPWALRGTRPPAQLAPGAVSALPLLTAVQVGSSWDCSQGQDYIRVSPGVLLIVIRVLSSAFLSEMLSLTQAWP